MTEAIKPHAPSAPSRPILGLTLALVLSGYQSLSAFMFYVTDAQRMAYTGVAALIALVFSLNLPQVKLESRSWNLVFTWSLLCILPFFPALTHRPPILGYIVGDFATITLPLLILVVGMQFPELFRVRPTLLLLALGLLFASGVGVISTASGNARHEAPSSFLIALAWLSFVFRTSRAQAWATAGVLAYIAYASASSGYRSSMVHVAMLGAMAYFLRGGARRVATFGAIFVGILVVAVIAAPKDLLDEQIRKMRIATILDGSGDASINARFDEAYDVGQQIRKDWGAINYLVGAGHGATFVPIRSNPERNITAYGTVHNIHATPMLLFYRYGLLGATAFLLVFTLAVRRFFSIRRGVREGVIHPGETCITVALLAYLADSFKHVTLVDPVFSFCVAGLIYFELRPPERRFLNAPLERVPAEPAQAES